MVLNYLQLLGYHSALELKIKLQNENDVVCIGVLSRGGVEDTRLEAKAKDTKKSEAKDSLSEDRHSRGQGQAQGLGPRTQAQVLSKKKKGLHKIFQAISKKKRSSQKFFWRSPQKNVFQKIFQALLKISKNSAVLEPRTGQFSRT